MIDGSEEYGLYGVVCTIDDITITLGQQRVIASELNASKVFSVVRLTENKVFVAYSVGTKYILYGATYTINGTNITSNAMFGTELNSTSGSGNAISAIALSEDKVLIAHSYSTNYPYITLCTISDNGVITLNTTFRINTATFGKTTITAILLQPQKVLIIYGGASSDFLLYGVICTINGTVITTSVVTQLCTKTYSGVVASAIALSENEVFIAHSSNAKGQADNYLHGILCTINGTSITTNITKQLSTLSYSGDVISTAILSNNKIIITHSGSEDSSTRSSVLIGEIKDDTIIASKSKKLDNANPISFISSISISNDKIFIGRGGYSIDIMLLDNFITTVDKVISSIEDIRGIANTSGTEGETIEVYVPEEVSV